MNAVTLRRRLVSVLSTSGLVTIGVGCGPSPVASSPASSSPSPTTSGPASATSLPVASASAGTSSARPETLMSVDDRDAGAGDRACDHPERRCFAPRTSTAGGSVRVDLATLPFDKNGCLPAERTGGSCAGYRATSGPTLRAGACCYEGCSFQPAPCGRPLTVAEREGTVRSARIARLLSASVEGVERAWC